MRSVNSVFALRSSAGPLAPCGLTVSWAVRSELISESWKVSGQKCPNLS